MTVRVRVKAPHSVAPHSVALVTQHLGVDLYWDSLESFI
jgi:hypothetical protein